MADVTVYRYDVNVATNGQTQAITDIGDTSKAFVRVMGCSHHGSAGPTNTTGNADPDDASGAVQLTDTNELTFYRSASPVKMIVEVWAYTGAVGGPYEFVNRGRGSIVNSSSSATSSAISSITNVDDCIPFHNGVISGTTSRTSFSRFPHYMYVNASKQIVIGKNNTGDSHTLYYDCVEFTGSAWNVGHAKSSAHDTNGTHFTGGELVTMNTASTGTGGTTFDVSDWSTAIIMDTTMGGDSSETGLSDTIIYTLPGTGTTTIRFTLDNTGSRNDSDAYAHILQTAELEVFRNTSSISEGNGTYGTPPSWPTGAPTSGGLETLALEWSPGTNGEGTAHARGSVHALLYDNGGTYQIRHWVHRSGNDVEAAYGVADLSGLVGASTDALEADDITSTGTIDNSSISQVHVISGDDITSMGVIEEPSISEINILQSNDLESTAIIDLPGIGQLHVITASDISSAAIIEEPTLIGGASDALQAEDISATAGIETPALRQSHIFSNSDLSSTGSVEDSDITQGHNFSVSDVFSTVAIDAPDMTQAQSLDAGDISSTATTTLPFLFQGEAPREIITYFVDMNTASAIPCIINAESAHSVSIYTTSILSAIISTENNNNVLINTETQAEVQLI